MLGHAPPEERFVRDGEQAGGVRPVLEELAVRARQLLEVRHVVGAETAERDDELGACDHVDRVELDHADGVDEGSEVALPDRALRAGLRQPLRAPSASQRASWFDNWALGTARA